MIDLKDDYRASAAIYAGIVADPGATKTPVLKFVSRPINRRQERLLREFRRDWAKYKQAKEEFDKEAKKSRAAAKESQKKGSKLKLLDPADEVPEALKRLDMPEKPVLLRLVSSDTTVEGGVVRHFV